MYNRKKHLKGERPMKKIISLVLLIALAATLSACFKVDATVATINGEKLKASLYNFCITNIKKQLKTPVNVDSEEYWEKTLIDGKHVKEYSKEKALDDAIKLLLIAQKAKEQGITLTADDKASIENQKVRAKKDAGGSNKKYQQMLSEYGLNEVSYSKILEYNIYRQKLMDQMQNNYTDEQIRDFYNNNMVNVKHVLILTIDESTQMPLQGKLLEQQKQLAEEIFNKIKNGEDFEELRNKYNQDPDTSSTGYTISKYSNMVEPFLSTSMSLQVGQVSDIIQTNYGYHIIKRYEHKDNNEIFTAAQTEIKNGLFWQDVENWKNESDIEINQKKLDKIGFGTL